ncbi:hypothetical protein PUN28_010247 [Cardiocondyla obscurior]|uniref:Uncharacterized protein n=1 Tax=Cardiocondyla obscurior TaxID=286306 RepID=A0AAW2FR60_9HYME
MAVGRGRTRSVIEALKLFETNVAKHPNAYINIVNLAIFCRVSPLCLASVCTRRPRAKNCHRLIHRITFAAIIVSIFFCISRQLGKQREKKQLEKTRQCERSIERAASKKGVRRNIKLHHITLRLEYHRS